MTGEERAVRRLRRKVRLAHTKKHLLVIGAFVVTGLLLVALASHGLVNLDLGGAPLSEGYAWIAGLTGAERLRSQGLDGTGVTACLVDTGIELVHPDLAYARVLGWNDLIRHEPRPYDDGGHGTSMAGLLAGHGRVQGIAPGLSLIVVKALRADGTGSSDLVGQAIDFCVDPNADGDLRDGADIISLSLGAQRTPFTTNAAARAATEAANRGIFVVSSAGNDGRNDDGDVGSPADEPLVIAVGSLTHQLQIAAFSSRGDNDPLNQPARADPHRKPEFVLPGVGLLTTTMGASYTAMTGTSASAALLSGILALLLEAHPELRKAGAAGVVSVKDALMLTAQPLVAQQTPHDDRYGYGVVTVDEAHLFLTAPP